MLSNKTGGRLSKVAVAQVGYWSAGGGG